MSNGKVREKASTALTSAVQQGRPVAKVYVTEDGNVVRGSTLAQYAVKGRNDESKQALPADSYRDQYTRNGLVEPLYNPEALARLLEINTHHMRASRTKARDVAGLGYELVPRTKETAQDDRRAAVQALLDEPHPELTIEEIFNRAHLDFEGVGNGYVELIRDRTEKARGNPSVNIPVGLAPMPGHTVRRHLDGIRYAQQRGRTIRWFKAVGYPDLRLDYRTGKYAKMEDEVATRYGIAAEDMVGEVPNERVANEVLHFMNYTPRSDYYGVPDILPALATVVGERARQEFTLDFFDNYGVPRYAVTIIGAVVDETMVQKIERFFHEGVRKNRHGTLVITLGPDADADADEFVGMAGAEGGDEWANVKVVWERLDTEVHEASFRLYRKDNRDEILSAHAVPPYRAGIAETGSLGGTTAQESTEIYKQSVVDPRQRVIEARVNRHILWDGFGATDWEFQFVDLDTRDEEDWEKRVTRLVDHMLMTPNEGRAALGREVSDDEAMDEFYYNGQRITGAPLAPADDVAKVLRATREMHGRLAAAVEKMVPADARGPDPVDDLLAAHERAENGAGRPA